jgi:DNA repair protein RadC
MEVREMPLETRPRERLVKSGPASLTDLELVSIMVGSGMKGKGVLAISGEILALLDSRQYKASIEDLKGIVGLGSAKAALILSAIEFARRILCTDKTRIRMAADVVPVVRHYADRQQEYFLCLSLNGAHELIATRVISMGLVNKTLMHPREVFAGAIVDRASSIICCHNHPSGNTEPSPEDREITGMLADAGRLLGITLLDHVIFSKTGYYSFRENDDMRE